MIALVSKLVRFEEAYPLSPFCTRRIWEQFWYWRVREPTVIQCGPHTHIAIGVEWGGSNLVYPVFVTTDGLWLEVACCEFDYVTEDRRTLRHVAHPR
jgi:hypothetical protein